MAIRIRNVAGTLVALCAARSVPQEGDVYLDDAAHYALNAKFHADLLGADAEERDNPAREEWDRMYANDATQGGS